MAGLLIVTVQQQHLSITMGSKNRKKKKHRKKLQHNEEEITDERFTAAINRPQFAKPKTQENKVVLDDRFSSVLTDPRFRLHEKDKYGRSNKQSKQEEQSEELSAFYTIEKKDGDNNERSDDDDSHQSKNDDSSKEEPQESDEEYTEDPASRIKYLTALSRGELSVSSSSSEDEADSDGNDSDSSDDDNDHEFDSVYGTAGVLDPSSKEQEEVPLTETPSPYVAVMDMDWQHVRAVDLLAILSSFTPPGAVRRVQVFPSNFGLERMAKEAQQGPANLWKKTKSTTEKEDDGTQSDDDEMMNDSDSEDDSVDAHEQYLKQLRKENEEKESDFDTEKLRAYEASKLKYYFAVVEFSSSEYADIAYKEVDGMELEHSSAAMDLRSIPPDEVEGVMKDRELRDEATSIPSNYQPPAFVVSALQQSSVKCTWEDGDEERQRKLTGYGTGQPGAWGEVIEEDDLRAYLASDVSTSDEDESGDEARNGKGSNLRKMLGLEGSDDDDSNSGERNESSSEDEEEDNDFSKQVTFIPGKVKLEDRIRSKLQAKNAKELTPWEKYQERRKEKRRERRQARRKLRKGIEADASSGSETDPEFGRAEFDSEDDAVAGVDDDFFLEAAEEKPTVSKQKKTKKNKSEQQQDTEVKAPSTKEELELLLAGDNGKLSRIVLLIRCVLPLLTLLHAPAQTRKTRRITTCVGCSESRRIRARN